MLSLVESMNDKLSLLNQVELDKVDRKLKMLSLELDDIARSEEKTGLPAHQEKKVPSTVPLYSLSLARWADASTSSSARRSMKCTR